MKKQLVILLPLLAQTANSLTAPSAQPKQSKSRGFPRQSISEQIMTLSRSGKTKDAINLYYNAFKGSKHKTYSTRMMNNAIGACARPFKPLHDEAFDIFEFGLDKGIQPNVYTYGSLMGVCAKMGNVEKCKSLLKQMKGYEIMPNSVIYSTAISACERCTPPRSDLAIELLREGTSGGNIDGFMNIVGYNAAISVCARAGEWKQACHILNEMERTNTQEFHFDKVILDSDAHIPKPDEVTYGTVMAACERAKEWHKVLELSKRMETERPDLTMDGIAISSALHACQQLSYGHDALEFLGKMKQLNTQCQNHRERDNRRRKALKGPDDVAFRLAISACARGGLIEEALELLRNMEKETGKLPDVAAYSSVIGGLAESGEYVKAIQLLKEMQKDDVAPNVISFSSAISACASASANADKARKEKKAKDPFYSEEDGLREVQRPMRTALKLLEHMKTATYEDSKPNIVTYNAAIRACAEGLDVSKAFNLHNDLLDRGLEPTMITYGSLMTACERVGDVEGASNVFREIRKHGIEPNEIIFGAAISCCRKAEQPDRTLALLRKMIESKLLPNTATYNTVIMAQAEANNMEKASAVFSLLTSSRSKAKPNRQTYNILVRALNANAQPATSEFYLNHMKEAGMKPDVELLTATVSSYERSKEPLKALQMMESMREDGYDFYQMKLFDAAFKQGVKVINNVVGKRTISEEDFQD
eukprot:scaffold4944_cov232-Chaetoceros_neogracile.AAC.2